MAEDRLIFFARHGETEWNRANRWQGQTDIPINDTGRAQARDLGIQVRRHGIARIESSDLVRASETANLVALQLGLTVAATHADLRERGFGVFEGLTRADCEQRYPGAWQLYRDDSRNTPPNAEPTLAVVSRMQRAVSRIMAGPGAHPLLLVGHGGALRALLSAALGQALPPMGNGALYRAVWAGEGLTGIELQPPTL